MGYTDLVMKISAIVSVFNTSMDMLEKSLASIAAQSCTCDYEIVIVDDGSIKSVHDYLEDFSRRIPNCRVITHEVNKGLSAARNTGMRNATGNCIFFPDSDDILFPDAIEKIHLAFEDNPTVAFVSFGWIEKRSRGEKVWKVTRKNKVIGNEEIINALCADTIFKGYVWNKVFNLDALGRDLPCFDTDLKVFEDKIWMLGFGDRLQSAYLIPDVLYSYEFNHNSITRSKESLRKRQFMYYAANRRIVSLSMKFGDRAYFNALEYFFSLTWNDYFYWIVISHFSKPMMKENAEVVDGVLKSLPRGKIHSLRNKFGFYSFWLAYNILRLGR